MSLKEVNGERLAEPFKSSVEVLETTTEKARHHWSRTRSDSQLQGRWWSIRTMYFITFCEGFSNSIILTSLWSYLKAIDDDVDPTIMGQMTATQGFVALLSCVACGIISGRVGCKIPLIFTTITAICSNVFYIFPNFTGNIALLFISRGLAGLFAGCLAITRVYLSAGTTMQERTKATSHLVASQMIGFTVGPIVQMIYVPVGEEGFGVADLRFNVYTLPAVTNILLASIAFICVIFIFKEVHIDDVPQSEMVHLTHSGKKQSEKSTRLSWFSGLDIIGTVFLNVQFAAIVFTFGVKSTVAAAYGMHILGWSRQLATKNFGMIMFALAGTAIVVVMVLGKLSKRIRERVFVLIGMALLLISSVLTIPFGPGTPKRPTMGFNDTSEHAGEGGCPWKYTWCDSTPAIPLPQYVIALAIQAVGYPMFQSATTFIYAKSLHPKHQGLGMGVFSAMGNIGKLLGALYGSIVYSAYGARLAFGSTAIVICLIGVGNISLYSRFIPYTERNRGKDDEQFI
ncbi:major facilitator superfamily domain-containing protein 8-like isoform X2 [Anneissia japonica]|uniref:major facilitator superfamily domain-containing protein 8-like isoform X2 n=1 Tax=Anneissia japonica TaxID=1529436 RepID=UPI0014254D2A|nr:major facilitator superfamily domain-containing protein 8-like isoform X2 [Anneissia japonica]